jgi:hypothetical protein
VVDLSLPEAAYPCRRSADTKHLPHQRRLSARSACRIPTPRNMIGPAEEPKMTSNSDVTFHYLKSPTYRTVHADGVFGGPTPSGLLELTIFSERFPIPTLTKHKVVNSRVGEEIERVARDGIVRELEVGCVMTIEAASLMRDWLDQNIAQLRKGLDLIEQAKQL